MCTTWNVSRENLCERSKRMRHVVVADNWMDGAGLGSVRSLEARRRVLLGAGAERNDLILRGCPTLVRLCIAFSTLFQLTRITAHVSFLYPRLREMYIYIYNKVATYMLNIKFLARMKTVAEPRKGCKYRGQEFNNTLRPDREKVRRSWFGFWMQQRHSRECIAAQSSRLLKGRYDWRNIFEGKNMRYIRCFV